jgi:hypothetical protein
VTVRLIVLLLAAGAALLATVAIAAAAAGGGGLTPELEAVKDATARYQSVAAAEAAGYVRSSPCEESPLGAMGHHYVNMALAADLAVDPLRPEVLLYMPKPGGAMRLVGVEYFVVALANTPAGPAPWFGSSPPPGGFFNPAPSLFGKTFDGPMEGHGPGMPWHYDLHAWVWRHNRAGALAQWNAQLDCP